MCVLLLKSGHAHREYSRARGKRIQVHPDKLGEAEKRVRSAALPSRFPRPCISSRIVSRKQKTGSLCPAFKSTQSSVSSAPRALFFPRPSPAHVLLFPLTLHLVTLSRSSPLLSCLLSPYHLSFEQRQPFSLLFPSLRYSWFFRIYTSFFISLVYSLTLTRSNSRLRLSRPS